MRPRRVTQADYRAAGRGLMRDCADDARAAFHAERTAQTAMAYAVAAKAADLSASVHASIAAELEAAGFKDAMLKLMS